MLSTRSRRRRLAALALGAVLIPTGCDSVTRPDLDRDRELRSLLAAARALARADGCQAVEECAAAPVGANLCGGPESYLVYCRRTTDEAKLLAILEHYRALREEQNVNEGRGGICVFVPPPPIALDGGVCTAVTP